MSISAFDLALYAGALFILFATPGPVWVATIARTLAGGFNAAWPLALGVAIGDVVWSLVAIMGVAWLVSVFDGFMLVLKWVAVALFLFMGIAILRHANKPIGEGGHLTKPSIWAGFAAGIAVILSNPKAILFYGGVLPGFFDLSGITLPDILAIAFLSMLVPLVGNLLFALFVDRARRLLTSPEALRRTNITAGCLLIVVGLIIPFV